MGAIVGIIMGSKSDYPTMKNAIDILNILKISHAIEIISAHRTPDKMSNYAKNADKKGLQVIIAGAGGAAHLPGMIAAYTHLPVLGVPIQSKVLKGQDSLLSIVQMPKGVAVATFAIGDAGAFNAGLMAAQIIATFDNKIKNNIINFRKNQTQNILDNPNPTL